MEILVVNVLQMRNLYSDAVTNQNVAAETGLSRLFVQIAESYSEFLVETLSNPSVSDQLVKVALDIIENVLICAANEDQEVSTITFNFWYVLSDCFLKLQNQEQMNIFTLRVQNHLIRLIECLEPIFKFPQNFDSLDDEDITAFRKQRYDATLVLQDVTCMLSEKSTMEYLVKRLQSLPANASWQDNELILYTIRSVARNVDPKESTYLPSIISYIPSLGTRHPMILYTCLLVLGRYSAWISEHQNSLQDILRFLVSALREGVSSQSSHPYIRKYFNSVSAAASSIKDICSSCSGFIAGDSGNLELIFNAYDFFVKNSLSINLQANVILGDHLEIIEALALVVSHLSSSQAESALFHFLSPLIKDLSQIIIAISSGHSMDMYLLGAQSYILTMAHFFKFYQGFSSDQEKHPSCSVIVDLWNLSDKLFDIFAKDEHLMENLCRIWKFLIRDMRGQFPVEQVLYPLLTKVVNLFSVVPQSCFIYIASVCVAEYGTSSPQFSSLFLQLFNVLCDYSLRLLSNGDQ
jgi:transportin-3